MTRYTLGVKAEYAARDKLLEMGASLVVRSAGSHGPVDLVAFFPDYTLLVQIKTTTRKNPSYRDDLDKLAAVDVASNCVKELWCWFRNKRAWVILPC